MMLGAAFNESFSITLVNTALLVLTAIVPLLLASYVRFLVAARQLSPDFHLRRLEATELDRAEQLYRKISQRLKEIEELGAVKGSFRERMRHRAMIRQQYGPELEDLQACANHLRASIVRLRHRPIQRLRHWVHIISCRYALSGSLATYLTILAPVTVFVFIAEQPHWAQELAGHLKTLLLWKPVDERVLYVNGITAALAALAVPILYLARRVRLYSDHRTQTKALEDFASTRPDQLIEEEAPHEPPYADDAPSFDLDHNGRWYAVLGLSPTATVDQVREAYKAKIKQSHPDRVQDMTPAIRHLAEAETKRLNAAYEEALTAARAS